MILKMTPDDNDDDDGDGVFGGCWGACWGVSPDCEGLDPYVATFA